MDAMDDVELTPPVGATVWDREMYTFLVDHVRRESTMLNEYADAAEQTGSQALAYLVNLLIEDERRHHRFFVELASSLKSEAELSGVDPIVPRMDLHLVDRDQLLELTNHLLDHERDDLGELKRLRKELGGVEDVTLWALLVDIMLRDTEKHIAILQFVKDHAKRKR